MKSYVSPTQAGARYPGSEKSCRTKAMQTEKEKPLEEEPFPVPHIFMI